MTIAGWVASGVLTTYAVFALFPGQTHGFNGSMILGVFLFLGALDVLLGSAFKGQKRSGKFW